VIDDAIFITGAQRSGTTLLEKLLAAQDHISLLSQPFPLLFVDVKRAFLHMLGCDDDLYPLGHLFLERRYASDALGEYLGRWRACRSNLELLFDKMSTYSGQYTRFTSAQLERAFSSISSSDDFASVVTKLDRSLAVSSGSRWFGSKETMCEEFARPLLDRGFHCAIIIRDPRDVIASLNHDRGQEFGGAIKPTLFNARNWRKSVAFALAMESHPRFHWCRYEDLVANPDAELSRLAGAIGIDCVELPGEIRDSAGAVWRGNSSHGERHGVDMSSVGSYRQLLPHGVSEFAEAACLPELQFLGYETTMTREAAIRVLHEYREPYTTTRAGMQRDAATPQNLALEAQRLERLTERTDEESPLWFLFPLAHAKLRETFRQ
jgi:hypothetical protein